MKFGVDYVIEKPRKNGTSRVYFCVPPAKRPQGWLPNIPLPLSGPRTGDLSDEREVRLIERDARSLHQQLLEYRNGARPAAPPKDYSFGALLQIWRGTEAWDDEVGEKRRKRYPWLVGNVEKYDWGTDENGAQKNATNIDFEDCEQFLKQWKTKKEMRRDYRSVLNILFGYAVAKHWRTDNPMDKVRYRTTSPKIDLWRQADVDRFVAACRAPEGSKSLAALILLGWETGQRLGDLTSFRHQYEYNNGYFKFQQNKTGAEMEFPIPVGLAAELRAVRQPGQVWMFIDERNGKPFTSETAGVRFRQIRNKELDVGEARLTLSSLRHSCVVRHAERKETLARIASLTGHSLVSLYQIINRYIKPTKKMTRDMLIEDHIDRGGSAEDFEHDPALDEEDLNELAKPHSPYAPYQPDPAKLEALVNAVAELA